MAEELIPAVAKEDLHKVHYTPVYLSNTNSILCDDTCLRIQSSTQVHLR